MTTNAILAAELTPSATESSDPVPRYYPIGTPGKAWAEKECQEWKSRTVNQRSYKEEVLSKVEVLKEQGLVVEQYNEAAADHPLYAVHTPDWKTDRPSILVTGGVHGYETSGVQGALKFLKEQAMKYADRCNIMVVPCVSPWAYEHIQRWNADLLDPNRSFTQDESKQTYESKSLMAYLSSEKIGSTEWTCHLDLHETTDTDASEFMPAKHAKAGVPYSGETIPDGFYLVGDDQAPQLDFQTAVIENVKKVTHIAPPDADGAIIGVPLVKEGVIVVPAKTLGLCCRVTNATYVTTTEVYPDSPKATPEICNDAQVAAVVGAIDFILQEFY